MPDSPFRLDHAPCEAATPRSRWAALASLTRLSNQSGTFLLMLPTWWTLLLASQGRPPLTLMAIFAAGSFLMRSAGVIMNDLADRSYDRQVARTRTRPLASGALRLREALAALIVLLLLAASLLAFLNPLTIFLSPVAFLLAALYPFSKRIMHLPQIVLGLAFGWGTVMAWSAARNGLDLPGWLIYGATAAWAVAYDTIYALQDRDDDARAGVKSSALLFGARTWIGVGGALAVMLTLLGLSGWLVGAGPAFYGMLAAVAGFVSQQVWVLRGTVPPATALALFKQHVWVGWAILAGIWAGFL